MEWTLGPQWPTITASSRLAPIYLDLFMGGLLGLCHSCVAHDPLFTMQLVASFNWFYALCRLFGSGTGSSLQSMNPPPCMDEMGFLCFSYMDFIPNVISDQHRDTYYIALYYIYTLYIIFISYRSISLTF